MIVSGYRDEDAVTGLELIIIIAVFLAIAVAFLIYAGGGEPGGWSRTFPGGMVADTMYASGDHMQPVGSVYGFPAVSRTSTKPLFIATKPDSRRLGAVSVLLSLFIGHTGAIDMDQVRVTWSGNGSTESITQTNTLPLVCPNWTITGKYNMLPGHVADADNWMEPDEEFELLICSSRGAGPGEPFTVTISPEGTAMPLSLSRTAPSRIERVMKLG